MKNRGIIHPRLLATVTPGVYPSRCTLQQPGVVVNEAGDEIFAPVDIPELTDLACRIAPASTNERRSAQQQFVVGLSQVSLAGYYPTVDSDMTPVVDGKAYTMEGEPEHDGNHATTRFFVREVE